MDNFLSILVVAIFYLAIAFGGNRRKKAQNAKRRASRKRQSAFDQAFSNSEKGTAQPATRQRKDMDLHQQACASSRLHLHEVTQQQMHDSAEGEDPCHRGGVRAEEDIHDSAAFSYDEQGEENTALAQDVLRGVIMSEILTRPIERAAMKRNGRSIR